MDVPKNAEKYAKILFRTCRVRFSIPCLVVHIADKGSQGDAFALTKKRGKKREIEGSEGKLLVNCGKKREKKEGRREKEKIVEKNGKRERIGGRRKKGENKREGKVGKPGGPKACYMIPQTSLELWPAISRPPLHEKRPCSNRRGRKHKNSGKNEKNAHLSRAHTGS